MHTWGDAGRTFPLEEDTIDCTPSFSFTAPERELDDGMREQAMIVLYSNFSF